MKVTQKNLFEAVEESVDHAKGDKKLAEEVLKTCNCCFISKPILEFSITRAPYRRNYCRSCHSAQVYRGFLEKKLKEYPQLFVECDVCDHIYPKKHSSCIKCSRPSSCVRMY
jgi:hypothetical protein